MQPENLEFWIDLNLPPVMASWLTNDFYVSAKSFKELGFETSEDILIFKLASSLSNTIIITTKDVDFINLSNKIGSPPKILFLNVGNISNKNLKQLVYKCFSEVIKIFLESDKSLVEITI